MGKIGPNMRGAIQNALENGWKPLTRTLLCLPAMPSALLTPDPPRKHVLAPNLTRCPLRSRHWNTQLFGQHADETEFLCAQSAFSERSFVDIQAASTLLAATRLKESSGSTMESETIGEPARRRTYLFC